MFAKVLMWFSLFAFGAFVVLHASRGDVLNLGLIEWLRAFGVSVAVGIVIGAIAHLHKRWSS